MTVCRPNPRLSPLLKQVSETQQQGPRLFKEAQSAVRKTGADSGKTNTASSSKALRRQKNRKAALNRAADNRAADSKTVRVDSRPARNRKAASRKAASLRIVHSKADNVRAASLRTVPSKAAARRADNATAPDIATADKNGQWTDRYQQINHRA